MAIALDGSTPAFVTGTTATVTTASFSPPANSLLIAFVSADENNTFTVSGGSLTWTTIDTLTTASGSNLNSMATRWAFTSSALTNITVSSTRTNFNGNFLKVCVFTGTESSFSGAHGTAQANSLTLTGTQTGSWFWAMIGDNLGSTADGAGTGCTYNDAEVAAGGISAGVLKRTSMDGTNGGNTTMSAGSGGSLSIAMVEIKAGSAAAVAGPIYPMSQYMSFR